MNGDETKLLKSLIAILSNHCGERGNSESAIETLSRIIEERDMAMLAIVSVD